PCDTHILMEYLCPLSFCEGVEFLPTMNAKKVEKRGPKRWVVVCAVLLVFLLVSLIVGLLVWHFKYRRAPVQKVYNGHLVIVNMNFIDAYENSSSTEFAMLSKKVQQTVRDSLTPPHVGNYLFATSICFLFCDACTDIRTFSPALFSVESCNFALHAKEGEITSFTTPGFPNSPYPNNARCIWVLRADADSIISLTFKTFDVEGCSEGSDFIRVYNSLSPVEPHTLVTLCGSYPPSYNLTFLSSQNVMLVMLITNAEGRNPGFKAEFFQLPKTLKGQGGTFTTPYYPAHYPSNMDCVWDIEVPSTKNVKVRFNLFYVLEPGVPVSSCTKDYVEISNTKYCGERSQFVVASNNNKITVRFHSDQSYTDTGFSAEFLSYDSSDPCPGKFTCKTGRCIDKVMHCDGWMDCTDGSDERSCNCTKEQFRCNNGWCKPRFWLCDGVNDCGDNSDELQCKCPDKNFKCSNGKCIPETQKCDGKDDCGDGSDEGTCSRVVSVSCKDYTYKCRNSVCLSKTNPECDGTKDCADNSDEESCDCGIRSYSKKTRIVGGQDSEVGEWPWQVSLHVKGQGHVCGASLISDKWLVSAAHCFQDQGTISYSDPKQWTAFLGLHDQSDRNNKMVQERSIKSIISNTQFNDFTYDYDIAVLELQSPVEFTTTVRPVCLPDATHDFPSGKEIWVTGWGATSEGGAGATILQKATIRVINQTTCNTLLTNQITPRMMCVGILTGGIDACQGDSGGPLVSVENSSRLFLAGVVSWGDGCAQRNKPGVYTRVSKLRDWIKQHTGI
uniref:matriptase n=1 Tax=Gopherus evgoodei TaxID=1825980 RepID=A0A8C4WQA0_9SAUR